MAEGAAGRQAGLTLIELMVAMSLGAAVVLLVAASFRFGLAFLGDRETVLVEDLRRTASRDLIWQQVVTLQAREMGRAQHLFIKGTDEYLAFLTPLSLRRQYSLGLVVAYYAVGRGADGSRALVYRERRDFSDDMLLDLVVSGPRSFFEKETETVMIEGFDEVRFSYLKEESSDRKTWVKKWDMQEKLPRAVRITLVRGEREEEIVAPVMVTSSFSFSGAS